jgi:ferredoxin
MEYEGRAGLVQVAHTTVFVHTLSGALPFHHVRVKRFAVPASIFVAFWTLAILLWLKSGQIPWIINFGYKITSRFSLLKIAGNPALCTDCGTCATVCPMDIRIPDYVRNGKRVLATECMLCFTCTNACVSGALHVSFGLDASVWSLLRYRD